MKYFDSILNRDIYYIQYSTEINLFVNFPKENWAIILLTDEYLKRNFQEIIKKSIENNVHYIVSVGKHAEVIHEMAEEEIAFREVDIENLYLPKHNISTIGNNDFENGIWEGIYLFASENSMIEKIIILDMKTKSFEKVENLIKKFKNGYLPKD